MLKFIFSDSHRNLSHTQAYILLVITTFLWAVGVVIARGVRDDIPLIGLSFWRWFVALLILMPFVYRSLLVNMDTIKRNTGIYVKQGILMIGSGTLLFYALNYTTAINATLVNATQPVITFFLAWIMLGQKHTRLQGVGALFALAGIATMVTRLDLSVLINLDFNIGDLLVIMAIFGYGFYAVNIHKIPHELGAFTNLTMIIIFGALFILPFYVAESIFVQSIHFDLKFIITILVLSTLVSITSMRMWNTANAVVGPGKAAIFVNLMPVFGSLLAVTFLSETLYLYHVTGTAMVCCGIFMVVSNLRNESN